MSRMPFCKTMLASMLSVACCSFSAQAAPDSNQPSTAPEQNKGKPNIVVIFGDDIGYWNLSTYNQGMLGYQTPNIDSIAAEGAKFTSYYAEQSSTAGRSSFITGQMPFRTGMSKVGMPGAPQGLQKEDPTIANILKQLGYATGQFGKNHLGDRNEFLPTAHGFDEFMGNLYHLNAEEEPENPDYPQDPEYKKQFGPRGVIKSTADGKIEDTGPLNIKRMETVDEETLAANNDFMERQVKANKPFFTWYNTTRMHNKTHIKPADKGVTGLGDYADGMVEHDKIIGEVLKKIKDLGIEDNTIVVYTTDNGPMTATWPDAGITPFRGEKNTGWEGGFRVPAMIKWPGHIKPGTLVNDIVGSNDWFPTLVAAAGVPDIKQQLLKGYKTSAMNYKVHLDGYNQLDYITGKTQEDPRKEFFYWSDDGDLLAMRYGRWKAHFMIQEHTGMDVWKYPFVKLRVPLIFDLKIDPLEKGTDGMDYNHWFYDRLFLLGGAQKYAAEMLQSFKEFPPRQKPGSFTVSDVSKLIEEGSPATN
ncbi:MULTISPECIES: arylsulfatase [Pantoea]|uniref:Arylsulfatase n=1 Tax=Candidatus Pantoea symbiotica TaxID=1884370 RepID=A0A1I3ZZ72_9GAMM|nr:MULTISPECIES: arylsulfatase [Pantoea]MRS18726.1 sulfatase-like hydrolase/transferase [Enterobacteriaceae bacterium RIT692]MRT25854.1 sulfatase-like hydrolase/transferase [Enterobacteriaceae bacterium RIT697]MRT43436.1 sulfatase-like hydrolase/transferase [Enterobacteriaceae bacterium RIT702]KAJ9430194.1 arylsulfatase [Pantoea sp. YR343]UVC32114.1 arylsulfatase [Pantoea sp. SOD02]